MTAAAIKLPAAIVTLSDEHRYMNLLLETMQEHLDSAKLSVPSDYYLLQDIARYMHEYPDREHHPTEDLMFERLVKRNPAREIDVARLRREHKLLRENTAEILELLDRAVQHQSPESVSALRAASSDYVERLRRHMRFEETDLFPSAVRCLANKDWQEIDRRVKLTQDPLFGPAVHRDFRVLYEYFAARAEIVSQRMSRYGFLQLDNMILSVDAIETGIADMLEMMRRHTDAVAQEFEIVNERSRDDHSLLATITAQAGYAGFVGKTACSAGCEAVGIYFRTLRNAAASLFSGEQ